MGKRDIDLQIASELCRNGDVDEARKIATDVLNEEPDSAAALFITAWAFIKLEQYGIAYNLLKRSVELNPRYETWINLGMASIGMQKLDEAESFLRRALKKNPDAEKALNNLALISVYNCKPNDAIHYAEKSLAIDANQFDVRESLGYAHLMLQNWEQGWQGYESMIGQSKHRKLVPPHQGCPYWLGEEDIDLVVRGEQGVGDEISFASILPDLLKDNKNVTLECDAKLEGLFKRSFPSINVHGTRHIKQRDWADGKNYDAHCLIGSLANKYRKSSESFPGTPFLIPDEDRRLQWRALLDTLPGKKVGIAWTGGLKNTFRSRRSFNLEGLLPILKTEGISWVSLQYQDPTDEIELFEERHDIKIHHWKRVAESQDYDDQAALVAELDCVVSVCTAVVHLCGAIGQKAYVLVPNKPRWFYGMEGKTLPWYKSIELYRQTDKWPVERIAHKLREDVCILKAA